MSIDESIARNEHLAHYVLPIEFDAERKHSSLMFTSDNLYQSDAGIQLDISPFAPHFNNDTQPATTEEDHKICVQAALVAIQKGTLEKVVVSCVKHAPRKATSLESLFLRLVECYPSAFVYLLHHPVFGIWIGATPELLLHKQGKNFRTVSLAGTQPFSADSPLVWSEKLQHEQHVVTDFILEKLSICNAIQVKLDGPYTAQAGPLAHLKTDIRFHSIQSSAAVISELQPTPAVCGLPREQALAFILEHAKFDRRLYCGRLGLSFPSGDEIHFVNLRCMQVFEDHFELHVGGGIVAGSTPEDEWHETEIKANVLRNLLH